MESNSPDKLLVFEAVMASLERQLAQAVHNAVETSAGATHEEAKPENPKDTRALEQTYLARGQAARVEELSEHIGKLRGVALKKFKPEATIEATALVQLEDEEGNTRWLFLLPHAGGTQVTVGGVNVLVVTPVTPLGAALLGRSEGDAIEILVQGKRRESVVSRVV